MPKRSLHMPKRSLCSGAALAALLAGLLYGPSALAQDGEWMIDELPATPVSKDKSQPQPKSFTDPGVSGVLGSSARKSLDADLIVSILQDRVKQAALRLVADTLTKLSLDSQPLYVRELIDRSVLLLGSESGARKDLLQDVAYILVRAVTAHAVMRTVFGRLSEVKDAAAVLQKKWRERLQSLPQSAIRDKLLAIDLSAASIDDLRHELQEQTYWLLGTDPLFGGASNTALTCSGKKGPVAAVCQVVVEASKKDRIALVSAVSRWSVISAGIDLVNRIEESKRFDPEYLIHLVSQFSDRVADFGATPGLVIAEWKAQAQIIARQWQGIPNAIEALKKGCSKVQATVEIDRRIKGPAAAAIAELDAAAGILLASEEVKSWLKSAAEAAIGATVPYPGGQICMAVNEIKNGAKMLAEYESAVLAVETFVQNFGTEVASLSVSRAPLLIDGLEKLLKASKPLSALMSKLPPMGTVRADLVEAREALDKARRKVQLLLNLLVMVEDIADSAVDNRSLKDILAPLSALAAVDPNRAQVITPVLDVLGDLLTMVQRDGSIKPNVALGLLSELRIHMLLEALGVPARQLELCDEGGKLQCWLSRLVQGFQEALSIEGDTVKIDGDQLLERFAAIGETYKRSRKWRFYFHLTVGMGTLRAFDAPTEDGGKEDLWSPLIAEQIGFGLASPSFFGDRVTVKTGLFASGLLFRAVLDSVESDAVMLGGFLALDLYESIELYVAPQAILFPSTDTTDSALGYGISAGIQVPLTSYLEQL